MKHHLHNLLFPDIKNMLPEKRSHVPEIQIPVSQICELRQGFFCLIVLHWGKKKHKPSAAVNRSCRGLSSKGSSPLAAFSLTLTTGLGGDVQPSEADKFLQLPLPLFEIVLKPACQGKRAVYY